jgi:hypothetical protein
MRHVFFRRLALAARILPVLAVLLAAKWLLMRFSFQPLEMGTLVSSMIAANVFLLGFLINGAMPDYKEAERLPGEMAASLDAIADEAAVLRDRKAPKEAGAVLSGVASVADGIHDWFHRRVSSVEVMRRVGALGPAFSDLEPHTQANFIVRLKQEQTNLRRLMTRAHSIRETTFAQGAYAIAELFTGLMIVTLLLVAYSAAPAALWFTGLTCFLLVYMLVLIHDLDDPFHYGPEERGADEVPLRPLEAVREKLSAGR